jgi:histidinol dehydrogenase
MSVLDLTPAAHAPLAPAVETLARAEGLVGHWRAVEVRVAKAAAKATAGTRAGKKAARRGARGPKRAARRPLARRRGR